MAESCFCLRISNRTFEHYSGIGYRDAGGRPERCIPLNELWDLYLSVEGYLYSEDGRVIGCRIKNRENQEIHEVFPGKVYRIDVWATTVDDDGCPEDICINYYLEIIPSGAEGISEAN